MSDFIGNFIGGAVQPASSGIHNLFQQYFHRRKDTWPGLVLSVSGGNVDGLAPGNGYKYHTFTSSGSLTISGVDATVDILAVGGGGGSDGIGSPGGGGGAVVVSTGITMPIGTYTVTVGAGGVSNNVSPNPLYVAGNTSSIHSVTSAGGPGGGGSGGPGGGPGSGTRAPGGSPGGGYGGAGSRGGNSEPGGNGTQVPTAFDAPLIGVPTLAPHTRYFGGGGGGSAWDGGAGGSPGGLGGGGQGASACPGKGSNGVTNTGGGAGGGFDPSGGSCSGPYTASGGSGIVVIRYLV